MLTASLACGGSAPEPSGPAPSAGAAPAPAPGGRSGGKAGKRAERGGKAGRGGSPAPAPAAGGGTVCWAEGTYRTCTRQSGWENCTATVARGGGEGTNNATAGAAAVYDCNDHMTKMVIIGNYPSGSADIQQWADVQVSCAVVSCE